MLDCVMGGFVEPAFFRPQLTRQFPRGLRYLTTASNHRGTAWMGGFFFREPPAPCSLDHFHAWHILQYITQTPMSKECYCPGRALAHMLGQHWVRQACSTHRFFRASISSGGRGHQGYLIQLDYKLANVAVFESSLNRGFNTMIAARIGSFCSQLGSAPIASD